MICFLNLVVSQMAQSAAITISLELGRRWSDLLLSCPRWSLLERNFKIWVRVSFVIKFGSLVSSESYFLLQVWYLLLTFRFFNQLPLITLIQISFPLRISLSLSEDHLEGVLQHVNGSSSASSFLWLDGVILHDLIQYVPPHCYSSCSFFRSSPFDSIVDSVQNLFCSFSFDSMEDFPKVLFRRDVLLLIVVREVVFELRVLLEHSHVFILQTISWVNWFVHRFEIFHSDQLRWESHTYLCPSRTSFMNLTVVHQFPGR